MKRFIFRLEKVLKVYTLTRDEAKRVLADIRVLIAENERSEEELKRSIDTFNRDSTSAELLDMQELYRARVHLLLERLALEKQELEIKLGEAMLAFQEAERNVKKLEKLKSKQEKAHLEELQLREQKVLDEFGTLHSKNSKHEGM